MKQGDIDFTAEAKATLNLLLDCLESHMNNPNEQKDALETVIAMCFQSVAAQRYLSECGGLHFIFNLGVSTASPVCEIALYCVATCIGNNVCIQSEMNTAERFTCIRDILVMPSSSVLKHAAIYFLITQVSYNNTFQSIFYTRSLVSLVYIHLGVGQVLVMRSGCLQVLIHLVRALLCDLSPSDSTDRSLWTCVVRCLCVCVNNPLNEDNQTLCGALLPFLCQLLKSEEAAYIEPLTSLISLMTAGNIHNQMKVLDSGGLEIILSSMKSFVNNINRSSLAMTVRLVNTLDVCIMDNVESIRSVGQLGVETLLLSLLTTPFLTPDHQLQVILTIGHILEGNGMLIVTRYNQHGSPKSHLILHGISVILPVLVHHGLHVTEENQMRFIQLNGLQTLIQLMGACDDESLHKAIKYTLQVAAQSSVQRKNCKRYVMATKDAIIEKLKVKNRPLFNDAAQSVALDGDECDLYVRDKGLSSENNGVGEGQRDNIESCKGSADVVLVCNEGRIVGGGNRQENGSVNLGNGCLNAKGANVSLVTNNVVNNKTVSDNNQPEGYLMEKYSGPIVDMMSEDGASAIFEGEPIAPEDHIGLSVKPNIDQDVENLKKQLLLETSKREKLEQETTLLRSEIEQRVRRCETETALLLEIEDQLDFSQKSSESKTHSAGIDIQFGSLVNNGCVKTHCEPSSLKQQPSHIAARKQCTNRHQVILNKSSNLLAPSNVKCSGENMAELPTLTASMGGPDYNGRNAHFDGEKIRPNGITPRLDVTPKKTPTMKGSFRYHNPRDNTVEKSLTVYMDQENVSRKDSFSSKMMPHQMSSQCPGCTGYSSKGSVLTSRSYITEINSSTQTCALHQSLCLIEQGNSQGLTTPTSFKSFEGVISLHVHDTVPCTKYILDTPRETNVTGTRRSRVEYTRQEEANIVDGVKKLGTRWGQILCLYNFHPSRRAVDLKEKYRRMMARDALLSC